MKPALPRNVLTCAQEPIPGPLTTDAGMIDWIDALRSAGCDCRSKLAKVKALEDGLPAPREDCRP